MVYHYLKQDPISRCLPTTLRVVTEVPIVQSPVDVLLRMVDIFIRKGFFVDTTVDHNFLKTAALVSTKLAEQKRSIRENDCGRAPVVDFIWQ